MHAVIRFNFFSIPFLLWAVIALVHNVISSVCSSCTSGMSKLFHLSVFGSPQASCWSSNCIQNFLLALSVVESFPPLIVSLYGPVNGCFEILVLSQKIRRNKLCWLKFNSCQGIARSGKALCNSQIYSLFESCGSTSEIQPVFKIYQDFLIGDLLVA